MSEPEFRTTTLKIRARLIDRIDACAREEGISRAEWMRAALVAAADRSEDRAIQRRKLESAHEADTE